MISDKFTILPSEIPKEVLDCALEEARSIWESNYTNKDSLSSRSRNFYDVLKNTLVGKVGEYILKHYYNYVDDDEKWHDLISPGGVKTEVKTWNYYGLTREKINTQVRELTNRVKYTNWFNAEVVIIIVCNNDEHSYTIYDIQRLKPHKKFTNGNI